MGKKTIIVPAFILGEGRSFDFILLGIEWVDGKEMFSIFGVATSF